MRYLLEIAYQGTQYAGWQLQPNAHTVQAEMQNALSVLLREDVETLGCGRTDTGVHARQFFLHFDCENVLPATIIRSLNAVLPYDIAVKSIRQVAANFNARFAALSRTYEYWMVFDKNPFLRDGAACWYRSLDADAMNQAAAMLIGKHDFQSFSKVHTDVNNYFCEVTQAHWFWKDNVLVFEITANRFLRNMVRAIVGTLVMVGEDKLSLAEFSDIVQSKDRREAGQSMPACGLYLTKVQY